MSHYEYYYVRMQRLLGRMERQRRYPDEFYVKPFRITDNIWYIGDKAVCSHLIDTGDGLVIIDSGFPELDHLLINAIWEAGFNPYDIKAVLHTHLHYDHFGATVSFQKLYNAKAYVGKCEFEAIQQKPELLMLDDMGPYMAYRMFKPDYLIHDGEDLRFGNTTIHCIETPGHTQGTLSFFINTTVDGKPVRAGTFGGAGFITIYQEFFVRYGLPNLQKSFMESITRLKNEHVDVVLGNHPAPNKILEKRTRQIADPDSPNPFLDENDWGNYLDWVEEEFTQFLADGH